jgi:hypothetical protein
LPSLDEVGVDFVSLKMVGRWAPLTQSARPQQLLRDHLQRTRENLPYLERPGRSGRRSFLALRSTAPLTLRSVEIIFTDDQTGPHNMFLTLSINPSRTLNRLMMALGLREDWRNATGFLGQIAEMSPDDFFHDPDPAGPNEWDNLIALPTTAQIALGRDPFLSFLPIYCSKLQHWIEELLGGADAAEIERTASATTVSAGSLILTLAPPEIRLQHCEVYFERRVASAHLIVERLAHSALSSVNFATARRYDGENTVDITTDPVFREVERKGAGIAVTAPLTQTRSLLIYAKRRDRIRFELKLKPFTGRMSEQIDGLSQGSLGEALLARLEAARRTLPDGARWADVLGLAGEGEQPSLVALARLVTELHVASSGSSGETFARALHDLLVTGGISIVVDEPQLQTVAETLVRGGVLVQRRVRVRDRSGIGKRYSLAEPYLSARAQWVGALLEQIAPADH